MHVAWRVVVIGAVAAALSGAACSSEAVVSSEATGPGTTAAGTTSSTPSTPSTPSTLSAIDPALVGSWTVHSSGAGEEAITLGTGSPQPIFTFDADGSAEVFTGCRTLTTTASTTATGAITFAATGVELLEDASCPDPQASAMSFAVSLIMGPPVRYWLEGGDLVLQSFDGRMVASPS